MYNIGINKRAGGNKKMTFTQLFNNYKDAKKFAKKMGGFVLNISKMDKKDAREDAESFGYDLQYFFTHKYIVYFNLNDDE